MFAKICRVSRTSLLVLVALVALYAVFLIAGNFHNSLSIRTSWKDRLDSFVDVPQKDGKEESGWNGVDNGKSRLREIEVLLRELNEKFNLKSQSSDNKNNTDDARTKSRVDKEGSDKDEPATDLILPLDFSKVPTKTPGNLTVLLERPDILPAQPHGVPMDKMSYMVDLNYKASNCPKTLGTIARYSSWFKERFKPGLKMYLDEKDIYNFDNYFKISHYGMPFGYAAVDRNILGLIMNNANFSNAPITELSDKCVRCAVVGCGGILNGSNAGQEIDSHDFVFRVNRAVTTGRFAQDVGRKTSFYEFFPESQHVSTVQDPNAAYLFTPFKKIDLYYAESMLRRDVSSRDFNVEGEMKNFFRPPILDPSRVKITHPDFFRYVFTHFMDLKGYRPTTGALVVFTAIYMCDEVTIYGFGYDPRFTVHYYDNQFIKVSDEPTGAHDIDNEKKLWDKLHTEGVIKLFKRDF
ncbi:CMP-N-acetylneuraminate-beta-galactosamide-alpha-2,3-sialyltransferase 1-like [Amphiura filiformis]|uniref:CMP-N-acetylneuraminate-beta-galactosamide- alpha-2,3-sialyltransferase 1-like n=1 Tax=Amphiura filiformis TaxID=82378 RepID=UPI003B216FB2